MDQAVASGPITKCKIVFLGDQSVGKTSIINRFIYDNFTGNEQPTVGIDFISKTLNFDNKTLRLQLWDTAGQERFRSLIPSYIRDSHAAIIVYDVSNVQSFQNIGKWIDDVKEERGNDVIIYILGNKIDLDDRKVDTNEGENKAKEQGCYFQEVSAAQGTNIPQFFQQLSIILSGGQIQNSGLSNIKSEDKTSKKKDNSVQLQQKNNQVSEKKSGCC